MNTLHMPIKPKSLQPVSASEMTLRDHFAAKAMQGELSAMVTTDHTSAGLRIDSSDEQLDNLSLHWYRVADSMLRTRDA